MLVLMNNPTLYIAYTIKYKTVLVYINSSKNTQNMNSICVACILLLVIIQTCMKVCPENFTIFFVKKINRF